MNCKLKKISNIFFTLLFALMVVLFTAALFMRAGGRNVSFFGYTFSVVVTPSMEGKEGPVINAGDFVAVKKTAIENIKIGDVVMYNTKRPENLNLGIKRIIHKVIDIDYDDDNVLYLTTKGTANELADDEKVTDIIGVYKGKSAFWGSLVLFYKNPVNIVFTVIMVTAFYICIKLLLIITAEIKKKDG